MNYYHVYIHHCNKKDRWSEAYELDLTEEELKKQIVTPFLSKKAFMCGGQQIDPSLIREIRISTTDAPSSVLLPKITEEAKYAEVFVSDNFCMIDYGKNVTRQFLNSPPQSSGNSEDACSVPKSNKIFVVHGWDDNMKVDVARTIEKIGLEAVILHEQTSGGKTIIEKFSEYANVSYAVVLLSPDDRAFTSKEKATDARPRARQNVILELGYFMGKLGRNKVFPLVKNPKEMDIPSDYNGVVYTEYDSKGAWRYALIKELRTSGFSADANKI